MTSAMENRIVRLEEDSRAYSDLISRVLDDTMEIKEQLLEHGRTMATLAAKVTRLELRALRMEQKLDDQKLQLDEIVSMLRPILGRDDEPS